ncbi:GNAT family N-acetyltransferase [Streptomyces sp. NPDC048639]|uniref:GNAT family N-acetyltransferase n=1 Tax=Streptomyces sp. NPDC048639 TaxID=3365581 RepID=UPI0037239932
MVRIREMDEGDIEAVSAVRVRGWQSAYAGLMPKTYLDAKTVQADAERRREHFAPGRGTVADLVAERGGAVVGWACTGPCRDEDSRPGDGELLALYVLPEHLSTGAGRALLEESVARAARRGFRRLLLWVVEGNTRARRFYGIAGFAPDGARRADDAGGTDVPEVRYVLPLAGIGPT